MRGTAICMSYDIALSRAGLLYVIQPMPSSTWASIFSVPVSIGLGRDPRSCVLLCPDRTGGVQVVDLVVGVPELGQHLAACARRRLADPTAPSPACR